MKQFAVIAALSADIGNEVDLGEYACSKCGTQTSSNLEHPHCFSCGSSKLNAIAKSSTELHIESEDDLVAIHCSACDCYNILPTTQVSGLSDIHCVTCATHLEINSDLEIDEAEPDHDEEGDDKEIEDDFSDDEGTDKYEGGEKSFADGQPDAEAPGGQPVNGRYENEPGVKITDIDHMDKTRVDSYGENDGVPVNDRKESYDDGNIETLGDKSQTPDAGEKGKRFESFSDDEGRHPMALADKAALKAYIHLSSLMKDKAISMITSDEVIHLVADSNVIVASLTLADAGANADIFTENRFLDAIDRVLNKEGLETTISSFKFTPVTLTVDVPDIVKELVSKQVQESSAIITSKVAVEDADMLQSMSIAASGINKGFFSELTNSLYTSLVNEVSTLTTVEEAQSLVDAAFSANADSYNKVLITKAREISSLNVEVRNQLSKAIAGARNFNRATSSDIGERLEVGATATKIDTVTSSTLVDSNIVNLAKKAQASGGLFSRRK